MKTNSMKRSNENLRINVLALYHGRWTVEICPKESCIYNESIAIEVFETRIDNRTHMAVVMVV